MAIELGDRLSNVLFAVEVQAKGRHATADAPSALDLLPDDLRSALGPGLHGARRPSRLSAAGVRLFDVVVAGTALIVAAPLMAVVALVVKASSPGPVFYGSQRLSGTGGVFRAWKFRSMFSDADERLDALLASNPELQATYETFSKLPHDPRVTTVGRWLRVCSLDELPQLANVVLGNMSLVGPRPKLLHEGPIYGDLLPVVCRVKPGLTGLWQVSGRSALSLEQRIILDVRYALTRTFRQDLLICLKTAAQLLNPSRSQAH